MAVISCVLLGTTGGVYVLDTMDNFINSFGILLVAAVSMVALAWVWRRLPTLAAHVNVRSSIKLRMWWYALVAVVVPIVLLTMLVIELRKNLAEPYEGYPAELLGVFGWGVVIAIPFIAMLLSLLPWKRGVDLDDPGSDQLDDHSSTGEGSLR